VLRPATVEVSPVSVSRRPRWRSHLACAGVALVVASLPLSACAEVETETANGYTPAKVEPLAGTDDVKRVTFTAEGAKRVGLQTEAVREAGKRRVVPYAAVIYDPEGRTFVYTSPRPLTYIREEIRVDRVEGDRALLSGGPPAGTEVVTVGAAEVYGAELEIGGGH
jgi:hypothetical protein